MAKNAVACESKGIDLSYFRPQIAEIIHCSSAVLDSFAFQKEKFTELKAQSTFSMKSTSELFRFIQSICLGKEAFALMRTRIFENLPFIPLLPQWTSVASMKELDGTLLQHAFCKNIWKKTVHVCGLQREELC